MFCIFIASGGIFNTCALQLFDVLISSALLFVLYRCELKLCFRVGAYGTLCGCSIILLT